MPRNKRENITLTFESLEKELNRVRREQEYTRLTAIKKLNVIETIQSELTSSDLEDDNGETQLQIMQALENSSSNALKCLNDINNNSLKFVDVMKTAIKIKEEVEFKKNKDAPKDKETESTGVMSLDDQKSLKELLDGLK